ncbi:hypothetical protein [Aeromicrobium sp. UC242_57]|uniref:hypothetical protein n=1 Tax=Aeromicrobium sp. UC242_57 TaxID=3374624 RepID=UPI0037ACA043
MPRTSGAPAGPQSHHRWTTRRRYLAFAVACLVVLAGFQATSAVAASSKPIKITKISSTVSAARQVPARLSCTSKQRCRGTVQVTVAGVKNAKKKISVAGKHRKTVTLRLTARQTKVIAASKGSQRAARVVVRLTKPRKVTVAKNATLRVKVVKPSVPDDGGHHGHTDPVYSRAYLNSWKPSVHEQNATGCTVAEHNSYAVTGVDGKLYPGWHPAVHTRSDGSTCTFGHEHGDDPRASTIYDWVVSELKKQNPAANGLPFGYGSEQLSIYAEATGSSVHRHEDDPGHKVIVSNDQQMGQEFRDANGTTRKLVCDILTKSHQGSWSSDATKNNVHEPCTP